MQMYKECDMDTRTFPEIYRMLSKAEQAELRDALMKKLSCTRQSVYNWAKGGYPIYRPIRLGVAKTINATFGYKVNHLTLFPNAR